MGPHSVACRGRGIGDRAGLYRRDYAAHVRGRLGSLQQLAIVIDIFVALLTMSFLSMLRAVRLPSCGWAWKRGAGCPRRSGAGHRLRGAGGVGSGVAAPLVAKGELQLAGEVCGRCWWAQRRIDR